MRIRLYRAFASNNSGSYTLIGSFRKADDASAVAALLQQACDEHHAWTTATRYVYEGVGPLEVFASAQGLTPSETPPGRDDEWPAYGPKPLVIAAGDQVLVHVPCTVSMPALFGELVYKHGGRVEVELNHTHHDLVVELGYAPADLGWNHPERGAALDAFEERLREALPALTTRRPHDQRPLLAPAFFRSAFGERRVAAVFGDLVEAVLQLRALADQARMRLHLHVWEAPGTMPDPLAALRVSERPWGQFRVILWQVGDNRIAAMKGVREALACGLEEAKAATADLPREIMIDIDERFAHNAVAILAKAGCDAEVVAPAPRS